MSASVQYSWGIPDQTVQGIFWLDGDTDNVPSATIDMPEKLNEVGSYKCITSLTGLYKVQILVNGSPWEIKWVNIPASGFAELEESRAIAKTPPTDYSPTPISPFRPA